MGDICDRFKRVRLDAGLKQGEYAEKLGERLTRIKDIERGKQRPPAEVLGKVVEMFHVDGGWLLTGKGEIHKKCVSEERGHYNVLDETVIRDTTQRVIAIAKDRPSQPDIMQLGTLRDLAVETRLTDEQIKEIFYLLEKADDIYHK